MEREEPKIKAETMIRVCREAIASLEQGKVKETIEGLKYTLDCAEKMYVVHNARDDVYLTAKTQLGEVLPGTRGVLISNDEKGLLVSWEIAGSKRKLVDLFTKDNYQQYVELVSDCED